MPKQRSIIIPSDKKIATNIVKFAESMDRILNNPSVFSGVNEKTKEALQLSVRRASICARNVLKEL